jgi:hypothetical protein
MALRKCCYFAVVNYVPDSDQRGGLATFKNAPARDNDRDYRPVRGRLWLVYWARLCREYPDTAAYVFDLYYNLYQHPTAHGKHYPLDTHML